MKSEGFILIDVGWLPWFFKRPVSLKWVYRPLLYVFENTELAGNHAGVYWARPYFICIVVYGVLNLMCVHSKHKPHQTDAWHSAKPAWV